MTLYRKVSGVWVAASRPYVKRSGVWTAATAAYVKRSGAWVQSYIYDVTPPNPPQVDLSIYENFDIVSGTKKLISRWIAVGIRLPGASNDPDARLTRVLTDYGGKPPTTQFGGTFTSSPDSNFPTEPWSEWRYNEFGPHNDTSLVNNKQWPRNATAGTIIAGDRDYHFTAWSLDRHGNWSAGVASVIHVPKATIDAPNVIIKEARFQPNSSGSWRDAGYAGGELIQQRSPHSTGVWFYGSQFVDSIGQNTSNITIRSASINIRRLDDNGTANANIYLYWTSYATVSDLPAPGASLVKHEITKLGTLAKGQSDWFPLPTSYNADLNNNIKGMGLDFKDPAKADAFPDDYSDIAGVSTNLRCGEVHVVWEEAH